MPNQFSVVETGSAGPLGAATLSMSSTPTITPSSGQFVAPILFTATLSFNQTDSIVAVFMDNDVNFLNESPLILAGGTITDGTGAYAGASGSLSLNFTMGANNTYTTTGSGSVTVGSKTTPLTLTNFHGGAFCSPCTEEYNNVTYAGTASPLGNATLISTTDVTGATKAWFATVSLNGTDSFNLFSTNPANSFGVNFTATVSGGTGAYATATGSFTLALGGTSNTVTGLTGSGTITTTVASAPIITSVKTAFGGSAIADNLPGFRSTERTSRPKTLPPAGSCGAPRLPLRKIKCPPNSAQSASPSMACRVIFSFIAARPPIQAVRVTKLTCSLH